MRDFEKALENSNPIGKLVILIGLLVGMPAAMILFFPEEARYLPAFLLPSLGSMLLGLLICWRCPPREGHVLEWHSAMERGSIPVMFAWFYAIFIGAVPFVIGHQLSFVHGLFEAVSGWTTTGLTVAVAESMPRIFLFHRSFMQFCGGLGFVILMAMLVQGKQIMSHYLAEGHPDRIRPSVKGTSRAIFILYMSCLVGGSFLFTVFGMGWFEAVNHTMAALSTAGFSTRNASMAAYNSLGIEMVANLLMVLGSMNFALLILLFQGKFRQVLHNSELRLLGVLIGGGALLVALSGVTFREGLFGLISALSTTGFTTGDYLAWPPVAQGILLLLMVIGGSAGSTAGGIKLMRAHIVMKMVKENVRSHVAPARQVRAPYYYQARGKKLIDEALVKDTFTFVTCYMLLLFVGTLLLSLSSDAPLFESFFEFASAFGTVGFSGGITSANANVGTLLIQMFAMLLGRLEIFIVFIAGYAVVNRMKKSFPKL